MGNNGHGFKEIVPGVLVSGDVQVKIPHPDPVWLIHNQENMSILTSPGSICVYSSQEKVESTISKYLNDNCISIMYSWDELVDNFGEHFEYVIVDFIGESGFHQTVPLKKGI